MDYSSYEGSDNYGQCDKCMKKYILDLDCLFLNENSYFLPKNVRYNTTKNGVIIDEIDLSDHVIVYDNDSDVKYKILCLNCMMGMLHSGELKTDGPKYEGHANDEFMLKIPTEEFKISSQRRLKIFEERLKSCLTKAQDFIA